jgi:hypothetical protein
MTQQNELEDIIQDLEEENVLLMEEYTRLQNQINSQQQQSSLSNQNLNDTTNNVFKMKSFTLQNNTSSNGSHKNRHQQYSQLLQTKYKTNCSSSSRALSSSPVSLSHTNMSFGHHNATTNNYYTNSNIMNSTSMINSLQGSTYSKLPNLFKPLNRSVNMLYSTNPKESQMINEARMLRQHEDRLEARMKILENHNRLLDSQLKQLKSLLNKVIFII